MSQEPGFVEKAKETADELAEKAKPALDKAGEVASDLAEKAKPAMQEAAQKAKGLFGKAKGFLDKQIAKPDDVTEGRPDEKPAE